ncbi:MAG: hypothetical protein ABR592_05320 [Nitriliruptorales bacterium]
MQEEKPERQRGTAESDAGPDEQLEPHDNEHGDIAPDLAIEPEPPADDAEDVARRWEAADPIEGEAPTG